MLVYSTAPLNAVLRLAGASSTVTLVCTAAGGILPLAGCLLLAVVAQRRQSRAVAQRLAG
ncbi:hypothetical protein [Frankia sp. ACN1ag]|uniref:hypothetical protein n=1 Tax=Frankia sp. ACN1ag TaxID=102891 RepID=UPI0006DC9B01|nr:hypothetical protein [Frankia sp. ACN1ag]